MKSLGVVAGLFASLVLAACGAEPVAPETSPAPADAAAASEPGQSGAAVPMATVVAAPAERWLLSEFDWGDSEDIVYESVKYTDGFLCYEHKLREHCAFVKTKVDGEELLAKFAFVDGRLWRIEVLTPELDASQADPHLERIWKLLVGYVTRFYGEAPEQQPFPQRDALAPQQEVVTRHWTLPAQDIQIVVARAEKEAKWFTSARFTDPQWAKQAPPPAPEKSAPGSAPQR